MIDTNQSAMLTIRLTHTLGICDVLHIPDFDQLLQLLHQVYLCAVLPEIRSNEGGPWSAVLGLSRYHMKTGQIPGLQPVASASTVSCAHLSRVRTTVLARPVMDMVKRALSIFNPTAKDSILAPACKALLLSK